MADFADANWKTRLAALEELTSWIEGEIETIDAEVVVRALAKKGWSEKNFQVGFLKLPFCCAEFLLGLHQVVRNSLSSSRKMSVVWQILFCTLCRTSKREAGGHEAEKASGRHAFALCREDLITICFKPRSFLFLELTHLDHSQATQLTNHYQSKRHQKSLPTQ